MLQTFPTSIDLVVLATAYIYVIVIIGGGELLRRWKRYSSAVTRKFIHLFAGFSIFTVPFYTNAWAAIIVAASFVILVYLASPKSPIKSLRKMFEVMARDTDYLSGHIWGPFFYAISITVLVSIFTLIPSLTFVFVIPASGLTAMYLGDGLASLIGGKFGKRNYTIGKATRTIEGSLTVFIASMLGAIFCFLFFDWWVTGGIPLFTSGQMIICAFTCGISATLIEGISPRGTDNFTVPILTTIILFLVAAILNPAIWSMIFPF